MAPTLSKPEANYHLAHTTHDRNRKCADCSMFRQGACTLVKGDISPVGTCDHYEPK
jgi:hypothetical protein